MGKGTFGQAWLPESNPQKPHGGRRINFYSCSWTSCKLEINLIKTNESLNSFLPAFSLSSRVSQNAAGTAQSDPWERTLLQLSNTLSGHTASTTWPGKSLLPTLLCAALLWTSASLDDESALAQLPNSQSNIHGVNWVSDFSSIGCGHRTTSSAYYILQGLQLLTPVS